MKASETTDKNQNAASQQAGAGGLQLQSQSLIDVQRQGARLRKFELQVFDEDLQDNGTINLRPQAPITVEVATPAELRMIIQQYKACGQVAKIAREIDPPPPSHLQPSSLPSSQVQDNAQAQENAIQLAQHQDSSKAEDVNIARPQSLQRQSKPIQLKVKPKIITIGDMQVKYDGDRVYQKQWVKLNATEASNFRVVNDATNKIFNLSGKHIEAKRWIQVKETSEDGIDDAVESILAGD